MSAILLVEDDPHIRRFVRLALEGEGCQVYEAGGIGEGMRVASAHPPELVVLDLGLPDGDGIELIGGLRAWSDAPILVLSARGLEADKVRGLDAGADDYLAKPFGVAELLARARALLRRHSSREPGNDPLFIFGDICVDRARRVVTRNGEVVHLTPMEYRLLSHFIAHPGRVLTHSQILREVWGPDQSTQGHYLRVYVGRLRHKFEADPARPAHLHTETGIGYRFEP